MTLAWRDEAALTVVMAAKGYPGAYEKGSEIRGLDAAATLAGRPDIPCRHRTPRRQADCDRRPRAFRHRPWRHVADAQARAYAAVDRIDWPGGFCRRDIGWRAIARETATADPAACARPPEQPKMPQTLSGVKAYE